MSEHFTAVFSLAVRSLCLFLLPPSPPTAFYSSLEKKLALHVLKTIYSVNNNQENRPIVKHVYFTMFRNFFTANHHSHSLMAFWACIDASLRKLLYFLNVRDLQLLLEWGADATCRNMISKTVLDTVVNVDLEHLIKSECSSSFPTSWPRLCWLLATGTSACPASGICWSSLLLHKIFGVFSHGYKEVFSTRSAWNLIRVLAVA